VRVVTVVGNRPQFIKAAAVTPHLRELGEEVLVHTGQHYDQALSAIFFEELGLPQPDHILAVGSGSHAAQTAAAMIALEPVISAAAPDAVLVYGDTNSTLAAGLVAAKLPLPLVHVEAGMRCFDFELPEEVNRVAVDALSGLLLCPTATAIENLRSEGRGDDARLVGDVMVDVAARFGPLAERHSQARERFGLEAGSYLLATVHRAGTADDPGALRQAIEVLAALAADFGPVVFPVHPRTRAGLRRAGLEETLASVPALIPCEPLGYLDLTALVRGAAGIATDSGGLQKEAYLAGVPCVTLRTSTEWVETVASGWNRLVGLDRELALASMGELLASPPQDPAGRVLLGDGRAGERCAAELADWLATAAPATASRGR
jgi:UDP-N-acetylglucosamine 2-epimerase (non-hydrolysing)/UDP-GlcNAc3NAcA epimerase